MLCRGWRATYSGAVGVPPLVGVALRAGYSAKFVTADRLMAHMTEPFAEMR